MSNTHLRKTWKTLDLIPEIESGFNLERFTTEQHRIMERLADLAIDWEYFQPTQSAFDYFCDLWFDYECGKLAI